MTGSPFAVPNQVSHTHTVRGLTYTYTVPEEIDSILEKRRAITTIDQGIRTVCYFDPAVKDLKYALESDCKAFADRLVEQVETFCDQGRQISPTLADLLQPYSGSQSSTLSKTTRMLEAIKYESVVCALFLIQEALKTPLH